jgi:hypothetical protein
LVGITGSGRVRLYNRPNDIGSSALQTLLETNPYWPGDLTIEQSSGPIGLVFSLNPLRFGVSDQNLIEVRGLNVWALEIAEAELPPSSRLATPLIDRSAYP